MIKRLKHVLYAISWRIRLVMRVIRDQSMVRRFFNLYMRGYLRDTGWFESLRTRESVDSEGQPIPWFNSAFNDFLLPRLTQDMDLAEYGSGNSTLYFARQVRSVLSIEHNREWFEKISSRLPTNAEIMFLELDDPRYCRGIIDTERLFHIIIIDGRKRVDTLMQNMDALVPTGVLILDDSHREAYRPCHDYCAQRGFRRLDVSGIAIGAFHRKVTSVFYRDSNCLGI